MNRTTAIHGSTSYVVHLDDAWQSFAGGDDGYRLLQDLRPYYRHNDLCQYDDDKYREQNHGNLVPVE
jgi:hypothetical protein